MTARRRLGRRPTRGGAPEAGAGMAVEEEAAAFWGPTAVDRCGEGRRRQRVGGWQIPGVRRRQRIPGGRGVRTGAPLNAAVRKDDGGRGHDGGGSGTKKVAKCWRGRIAVLYIYTTSLISERVTNRDKAGPFDTVSYTTRD
jgi:hypothetical protein